MLVRLLLLWSDPMDAKTMNGLKSWVVLHCIALGLLRKDRGLRLQAPLLLEGSVAITRLRQRGCGITQSRHNSISTSSRSSSYPPIYMVVV